MVETQLNLGFIVLAAFTNGCGGILILLGVEALSFQVYVREPDHGCDRSKGAG